MSEKGVSFEQASIELHLPATHCLLYGSQNGFRIIDDHMVKRVIEGELS